MTIITANISLGYIVNIVFRSLLLFVCLPAQTAHCKAVQLFASSYSFNSQHTLFKGRKPLMAWSKKETKSCNLLNRLFLQIFEPLLG